MTRSLVVLIAATLLGTWIARHAEGLVKLGHLDEGVEWFRAGNSLQATISKE